MSASIPSGPPPLQEGAGLNLVSPLAWELAPRSLGLPRELPPKWPQVFLDSFKQALKQHASFRLYLESCIRCGACVRACPFYHATGDPQNIPAARADLARAVYLSNGMTQKIPANLTSDLARPLGPALLADWHRYFHQCSLCRRCAVFCPLGIDTSEITLVCREILASIGIMSGGIAKETANAITMGNTLGITPQAWEAACQGMEAELELTTGEKILCPVDEYGAEVLLIPAASDVTTHQPTLMGYAKLFHAAGITWTTSSAMFESGNPGAFLGKKTLRGIVARVVMAARELRPRRLVWGESGHGWRVAANWLPALGGALKGRDKQIFKHPIHILALSGLLLRKGAFDRYLDPEPNDNRVVTYHDPCHLARSAGLLQEPRELLGAACNFLAEMSSGTQGRMTWCCGGGGGLSGGGQRELRLKAFGPRARALKQVVEQQGANFLATACDVCKRACLAGAAHYGLDMQVGGVSELFGQALFHSRPGFTTEEGPV